MEDPETANVSSLSAIIDANLRKYVGVKFESICKSFLVLTNDAAVKARVAGSFVSRKIASRNQKWMQCFVLVA